MLVREVMTRDPITVTEETTVFDAMDVMFSSEFRHLPVVKGRALKGMISERDLSQFSSGFFRSLPAAQARLQEPITSIMTPGVVTVTPESALSEAIDTMLENKVGALAVVDRVSGQLQGILSYVDVLRAVIDLV